MAAGCWRRRRCGASWAGPRVKSTKRSQSTESRRWAEASAINLPRGSVPGGGGGKFGASGIAGSGGWGVQRRVAAAGGVGRSVGIGGRGGRVTNPRRRPEHQEAAAGGAGRCLAANSVRAERSEMVRARWVPTRPQLSKQVPRRWYERQSWVAEPSGLVVGGAWALRSAMVRPEARKRALKVVQSVPALATRFPVVRVVGPEGVTLGDVTDPKLPVMRLMTVPAAEGATEGVYEAAGARGGRGAVK